MASILSSILECLGVRTISLSASSSSTISAADNLTAHRIISHLFAGEKASKDLQLAIKDEVSATGWTESLAIAILTKLVQALDSAAPIGQALKEAFDRATEEARVFVTEHPVLVTVIAIGILALLVPWTLEVLGFAELGIVEGEYLVYFPIRAGCLDTGEGGLMILIAG